MIAVDTNILVRYAMRDDPVQSPLATAFLKANECFVSRTVILETAWVLSSGYGLSTANVVERIHHVLCLPSISTEDVEDVLFALDWHEQGMDFADALHLSTGRNVTEAFATFDKGIANVGKRIGLGCPVIAPT